MKRWTKIILFVLMLSAVFVWVEVAKSPTADEADKSVRLYFFNVGQGDSEMVEMGTYQILIDGGPDDSVLEEIGKVMPATDRKIDAIILTHPHADHLTGLNQILDRYEIGKIYYSGVNYDSSGYRELLSKIKTKNIALEIPEIGTKIDSFPDGEMQFLWPGKKYEGQKVSADLNDTSEVARFCYFSHCALFTGDIETGEQKLMFDYYSSIRQPAERSSPPPDLTGESNNNIFESEILKLPHHGSTNGTDQALLDNAKPKTAVIEVGANNTYGHPHAVTLDLLQKANIQFYRTDKDGTVKFKISESGIIKQ